jgi:hypothetical protein
LGAGASVIRATIVYTWRVEYILVSRNTQCIVPDGWLSLPAIKACGTLPGGIKAYYTAEHSYSRCRAFIPVGCVGNGEQMLRDVLPPIAGGHLYNRYL